MTRALGIIAGTALILLFATLLLVVMPTLQLQTGQNPPEALQPWTESELAGRDHYISLGCVYCHSQQPRDPSQAPDTARGWGRASVPSDYSYDTTHLLGTMRTGPDLFNIGARQPSVDWHMTHLYQPRAVSPGSNMPAYPFLFKDTDYLGDQVEVKVPRGFLPPLSSKYIVPTKQATELVDYLLSLDRTYPAEELPKAETGDSSGPLSMIVTGFNAKQGQCPMNKNESTESSNSIAQDELSDTGVPVDRAYERENFEPEELSNPLPKWYAVMSACLVVWGFGYFYFQGVVPADAGDRRTAIAPAGSVPADGKVIYAANCVACHQGTGLGIAGAFPPLAASEWVLTDPQIPAQILLHGMQGPIEVAGQNYSGVMPTMAHLSDNELAAVLNYIRSDWGNNASEVSEEWLAEQRGVFPDRGPWDGAAELIAELGEPVTP